MSTTVVVIIVAVVALIIASASMRRGPRVTTIETRHERDDGEKNA